jgi:hypothetical protein
MRTNVTELSVTVTTNECGRHKGSDNQMKRQLPYGALLRSLSSRSLGSRNAACLLRSVGSSSLRLLCLCFRNLHKPINKAGTCERRNKRTLSASSFALASSSARRFSSSTCALEGPAPGLFLRFVSRGSFSSCLMRLIRGSAERATSTIFLRRAVSSFLRRARSVLFFFSVYRLSSRLH